jgi:hypothetical protein
VSSFTISSEEVVVLAVFFDVDFFIGFDDVDDDDTKDRVDDESLRVELLVLSFSWLFLIALLFFGLVLFFFLLLLLLLNVVDVVVVMTKLFDRTGDDDDVIIASN